MEKIGKIYLHELFVFRVSSNKLHIQRIRNPMFESHGSLFHLLYVVPNDSFSRTSLFRHSTRNCNSEYLVRVVPLEYFRDTRDIRSFIRRVIVGYKRSLYQPPAPRYRTPWWSLQPLSSRNCRGRKKRREKKRMVRRGKSEGTDRFIVCNRENGATRLDPSFFPFSSNENDPRRRQCPREHSARNRGHSEHANP